MTEDYFWTIIADTQGEDQAIYTRLLNETEEEIIAFDDHVCRLLNVSYLGDLWCAAYIACGGCSDDGFDYFRGWLISQGRETFEAALRDPDSVVSALERIPEGGYPSNEDMLGVAGRAYEAKTGKDFYALQRDVLPLPKMVFQWKSDKPKTMKARCPKVFERFYEDSF